MCTDSLVPIGTQALSLSNLVGGDFPLSSLAPVAATASNSSSTERCVTISHIGNTPSSWYSVWTPSPQLPGNSQVGLAHYKRGCLSPPLSYSYSCFLLAFLLPSFPLAPPIPTFLSPLSPCGHGWPLLLYSLLLSASTTLLTLY